MTCFQLPDREQQHVMEFVGRSGVVTRIGNLPAWYCFDCSWHLSMQHTLLAENECEGKGEEKCQGGEDSAGEQ